MVAVSQKSFGQTDAVTWAPTTSGGDVASLNPSSGSNIAASTLSSGNSSLGSGIAGAYYNSNYGIYGTGWSTNSSSPGSTSNTYIQFQITPNSGYSFSISQFKFTFATNDNNDDVAVYWSNSSTFSTSASIGSSNNINNGNTITYSGLTGISATAGQSIYIRVVFYYVSNPFHGVPYSLGVTNCVVNGTATANSSLSASPSTLSFGSVTAGTNSASQTFALSGTNLSAGPITVTAPSGFQVGNGTTWGSTYSISYSGSTLSSTTVSVRFVAPTTAGASSGNITFSGGGVSSPPTIALSGASVAGTAKNISINAGNGQSATVGTAVATVPGVIVTDQYGNPVSGASVTFAVATGGGTVSPATAIATNSSGIATVTSWTLGTVSGSNTLTAIGSGLTGSPLTFTATAVAGPAKTIAINAGNGQSATVGTAVATAPSVLVKDQYGNVVSGASVTFAVASGGGTVSPITSLTTNSSGIATVTSWTLGSTVGSNTLTATSTGLTGSPLTFTANATFGSLAKFAFSNIGTQTAGAAFSVTITAQDTYGNTVTSFNSSVNLTTNAGTISPATSNAFASGVLTQNFSVTQAGSNKTITATSGSTGTSNTFTVNAGSLSALNISNVSSPQPVDASIAPSVTITGTDAYGNAVNGGTINMTTTAGSITPASVTLNASGIVTVSNFVVTSSGSNQTITATSAANSSIHATSNSFTVSGFTDNLSGDYFRTNAPSDWTYLATWQGSHDGTNWYAATAVPTSTAASILVSNSITISSSVTSSKLTVSGGIININSGGNLTNSGTITGANTSTLLVNSGGTYTHALDGGTIPTATWNTNSTCNVTGITVTAPSGLGQSFGNFTWSSNMTGGYVELNSALTTINGTFTFSTPSTSNSLRLATNSSLTLNIGGNFVISGGGVLRLSDGSANPIINVTGNLAISNGSTLDFGAGTSPAASGTGIVNLKGSGFSVSGSSDLEVSGYYNPNGTINFLNASPTITSSSNAGLSSIDFNINSASTATLLSGLILDSYSSFIISSGGTLIMGAYAITDDDQSCSIIASAGSTIQLGSAAGITKNSYNHGAYTPNTGNVILNTGNYNFNSGANYIYNGSGSQTTGNALPTALTDSLTINNNSGVTLSQATIINSPGKLLLKTGTFTNSSTLTLGNGSTLVRDNGSLSAAPVFNATVNVSYTNLGANVLTQTTGNELPGSATALGNLTINKTGAVITLGASATINGILYLTDGLLTTSSTNLLKISSTGSVIMANTAYNSSSYVNGPVQRTGTGSFTFPIGKSGTGYVPIGVNPATSQTFTAEYFRASALSVGSEFVTGTALKNLSTCDYWRLDLGTTYPTSTNSTLSGTASVTLYWNQNNPCGGNPYVTNLSTLAIGHYNFSNGWDVIGVGSYSTSGDNTSGSITFTGSNLSFSPFALGSTSSTSNPLPIILDYFTASKAVGYNKLAWKVECNVSFSSFAVERSYDGTSFEAIGSITGSAASDCSSPYSYNDYSSVGNKAYYRIKITDENGNVFYSNIQLIVSSANVMELISVQPNPVYGDAMLNISASSTQNIELAIMSIDGKEIQHRTVQVMQGTNNLSLQTSGLAKGVYIVKGIFGNGQTNTIKFIKQ